MATTQTSIINWALTKLGVARITNPGDDAERAEAAAEIYRNVLRAELRRNLWRFSLAMAVVAEELPAPADGWRRFPLPATCLRLAWIGSDPLADLRWTIRGRHVLTDEPAPLAIHFVADQENPALLDALFVEVLVAKLARELAPRLRDELSLINALGREHRELLAEARRIGAIEQPPQQRQRAEPWVRSRVAGPWAS